MQEDKITEDFERAEFYEGYYKKRNWRLIIWAILFFVLGFAVARAYYFAVALWDFY